MAVTLADLSGFAGEAMATGSGCPSPRSTRPPGTDGRGEALTNLLAAPISALSGTKLSCNWMAARRGG